MRPCSEVMKRRQREVAWSRVQEIAVDVLVCFVEIVGQRRRGGSRLLSASLHNDTV